MLDFDFWSSEHYHSPIHRICPYHHFSFHSTLILWFSQKYKTLYYHPLFLKRKVNEAFQCVYSNSWLLISFLHADMWKKLILFILSTINSNRDTSFPPKPFKKFTSLWIFKAIVYVLRKSCFEDTTFSMEPQNPFLQKWSKLTSTQWILSCLKWHVHLQVPPYLFHFTP